MRLKYICETCGKTEIFYDEEIAYKLGWDYPPKMYEFGVVSPRTCGNCSIDTTLWWQLVVENVPVEELEEQHKQTLERILTEPQSIIVDIRE
ncbi:hypothetical protein [Bacillus cereus]|uniref:hypothetical protein n=1 Tax=Bacillus cereus TaxID=1396 RepID=UPI003D03370E